MTGADLARVLAAEPAGDRYLLPDVCLSDDGRFLDGVTVADCHARSRSSPPTGSPSGEHSERGGMS